MKRTHLDYPVKSLESISQARDDISSSDGKQCRFFVTFLRNQSVTSEILLFFASNKGFHTPIRLAQSLPPFSAHPTEQI